MRRQLPVTRDQLGSSMQRLVRFDVSRPFASPAARVAAQCLFGLGCAGTMIVARSALDMVAPSAGPFALVYPSVLIATLYGHWRAGLVAYLISFLSAWYFVLPTAMSFRFENPDDPQRVMINAATALVVLVFAESFRHAVTIAAEQRDAEIARRTMLMQELEHRTKNNFALVVSMLELQKRKETEPRVVHALDLATARIHSFARAYANLAETQGEGASVEMGPYLREVVTHFSDGAFHQGIKVGCTVADRRLPREVAVAIGLFTNEALTNAAKYAFPDGRTGRVEVQFSSGGEDWELVIADDGVGDGERNAAPNSSSGLGTILLRAFANQAQATYEVDITDDGRRLRLCSA